MPHKSQSALDASADSVLFSSEPLGWRQLNVQRRIRPLGGITDLPEGMCEHVVLVWHGASHVASVLGGMRQEINAHAPTQLIPASTPVSWDRLSRLHFTKVCVSTDCIDTLMLDLFDRDPARNSLVPKAINDDPILREHANTLMAHALSEDPVSQLAVDQVAQHLGTHMIVTYGGLALRGRGERRLAPVRLSSVLDYVEANLGGVITLDAMARIACTSKYHFLRRFKLSTGITPYQFVLQQRIRRAQELILSGRITAAEAAQQTGFCDQAHFSRVFKRAVGVTPRAFRRRD
ncbi:MAG TPA: AraC family transcriptional regulator [Steroidobacteraceae bacterium]|nr:AraC family transcriptional regulator [Steroidobacteraceae bacterium]